MAKLIEAIRVYCPHLDLDRPAGPGHFMKMVTKRTTLSSGVIKNVQDSEAETLLDLLLEGQAVHTGVAIYKPSIDLDGKVSVRVRVDQKLLNALNMKGAFKGLILNAENIGKTSAEIAAIWNEAHPTDPVM